MKLLVTGGAGFIGANFVHYLANKYPNYEVTVADALTYSGDEKRLQAVRQKIKFVKADVCSQEDMDKLVEGQDYVVHFAAETHVDKSIHDPGPFLRTNIMGTENLARLAIKHQVKRFHHISTDEVFGTLELKSPERFNENSQYSPRSPYAASKAASDHIVRAYGETYGLPYVITNCSNNYGPLDSPNRIIPLFITSALDDYPLPIYGRGEFVRDYLFVTDHCRAIDLVLHKADDGQTYCVGGGAERNGLEVAKAVLETLGKPKEMIQFVAERPGHDPRYAIDASKLKRDLGWEPSVSFPEGIAQTVKWYKDNEEWWRPMKERNNMNTWRKAAKT